MPTPEELADEEQRRLLSMYGGASRDPVEFPWFTQPPENAGPEGRGSGEGYAPAPQQPQTQSFMGGGPQTSWLPGLTGLGREAIPLPAPQVPLSLGMALPRQAPATPPPAPVPIPDPVTPPPRLAMPTQESHEPLPSIFSPQDLGGPASLDERVNPPTVPQNQGLEASIAGRHWNVDDPVALMGMRRGAIDWAQGLSRDSFRQPGVAAEYVRPEASAQWLREHGGGRADTIRFRTPAQATWQSYQVDPENQPDLRAMRQRPGTVGEADFPDIGRHETRHRGFAHLERLARVYGINFPEALRRAPYQTEGANVFEDRRTGFPESYEGMTFDAAGSRAAERDLSLARAVARAVNAERVRRLHATPGAAWSDIE